MSDWIKALLRSCCLTITGGGMPVQRCGHQLTSKKKMERIDSLVTFAKTATPAAMSQKMFDVVSIPQSTVHELILLLTLGGDPAQLIEDGYGERVLAERVESGSVCAECEQKFDAFLKYAGPIYEEMWDQTPLKISCNTPGRGVPGGVLPLCLDGGGMRGLVSVVCLLFSSRRLLGDESLPDYFDWLIGTSTGSMLALSLSQGKSLKECFFQYWDMKRKIFLDGSTMARLFGNQVTEQTRNIETILKECFPTETFHGSSRRLTVPAFDITTSPGRLFTFRNYAFDRPFGSQLPAEQDAFFREAARASSAAPTYFEPFHYNGRKLVDGSFVANSPLNILWKEYDNFFKFDNKIRFHGVISIGTGEPQLTERKIKELTTFKRKAINIATVGTLILEQCVGQDQCIVEAASDRCGAQGIPFIRLSPVGINVRIDQIDDGKLLDMIWKTLFWLYENVNQVDKLGELLFKLHSDPAERGRQRRSNTIL
ncbi:unnamed protein product, partial [Mesorhabditis belari]|uniref:PNPLA domain-containing protein n=1 Tax=Mesorhabditis belari TaxID=2138241 RepID=A0AAF3FH41_9BILA